MSAQKRLFLLDAYALIFRGYYAFIKNPRINSKGMDTSAILGFTNSLLDVIKREKPDHLAVAFDKGGSKERSTVFPEYKANRLETPEAIKIAVPYIQELLKAMHIPIIEKEGFEADDLIGTLSKQAEKAGYQTFMVTPDKDFAQLVSENIFMYRPASRGNDIEVWGIPEIQEKFDVERPEQVIDYLGMMGDAVDNIPGLPGVGDKTARKFIQQYGSMENLFANTHELKGKMKEKVEANQELGLLSKQLATIMLDCPVEFHEEDFELNHPDIEQVHALFKELEFRRTAENLNKIFAIEAPPVTKPQSKPKEESILTTTASGTEQFDLFSAATQDSSGQDVSGYQTIDSTANVYQYINSNTGRNLLLKKLLEQNAVSFHLVSEGSNVMTDSILGLAFSYEKGKGYYVVLSEDKEEITRVLQFFQPFFEHEQIEKISQNLKYTINLLSRHQINLKGPIFDTMLAHYLLHPDMRHDREVLTETYLNYQPVSMESLIGKRGKNQLKFNAIELKKQANYAAEYSDLTFQLRTLFAEELEKAGLTNLYFKLELPLLKVLAAMEREGIRLDASLLKNLSEQLAKDIHVLETSIYTAADTEFNLASPRQLGDVLFDHLKLVDKPKKTKTGQYATGEEILSKLAPEHEIVRNILDWRGLVKLKNTYVDALPEEVNEESGRIHTTFSQAVAATGRLSSNNPNLQNIPIRTVRGREVRKAFVPRDQEHILAAADYSQIELRIIAALSKDESMIASFKKGDDIHAATASKVFGIPIEQVTRDQRGEAKAVNFGIIYGQGAFTLAQQLNKSRKEAKELIDNYYANFPKLKEFIARQVDFARENGFVETVLGRRRYLKNINSRNAIVRAADERNAVNAPIQGSAADIIKLAMIKIYKKMEDEQFRSKMLLQVHDELVFDVYKPELDILKPLIITEMEQAYTLDVPLTVDMGIGENWLEAH